MFQEAGEPEYCIRVFELALRHAIYGVFWLGETTSCFGSKDKTLRKPGRAWPTNYSGLILSKTVQMTHLKSSRKI